MYLLYGVSHDVLRRILLVYKTKVCVRECAQVRERDREGERGRRGGEGGGLERERESARARMRIIRT